ncbi:N/A [soil metagenome]
MVSQSRTSTQAYDLATDADLDPLLERIGDAHYVLLGEASHGTHEYYTWRSRISKRLIEEKGFSFIAVEGDWPDCYGINRFVKGYADTPADVLDVLRGFTRWPTWMWANYEIAGLANWMRQYNRRTTKQKAGFYGLDVYSLWESVETLHQVLQQQQDPKAVQLVSDVVECFEPYGEDERRYARAVASLSGSCRQEVTALLREIRQKAATYDHDPEASLNAEMNAWVAVDAERYYESMYSPEEQSWNIRDRHMVSTLNRLMAHHGPDAKCIVWAHNTHIGDARYTDMRYEGLVNVGQLVREQHATSDVVLVGFGSFMGTVIAGNRWDAPMEVMTVPPARSGSIEALLHHESPTNRLLIFNGAGTDSRDSDTWLAQERGHRAIGVVYHPEREFGNYVSTTLTRRYDAFLYIDQTRALHPLHLHPDPGQMPEGYPFGV